MFWVKFRDANDVAVLAMIVSLTMAFMDLVCDSIMVL